MKAYNKKKINYHLSFTILILVVIWMILSLFYSPVIVPSPIRVCKSLIETLLDKNFYTHFGATLYRGTIAYIFSGIFSIIVGFLVGKYLWIEKSFYPLIVGLNGVPRISWILLAMIWLPFNSIIVVFILFFTIVPTLTMGVVSGYKEVPKELIEMGIIYNFSRKSKLQNIFIPSMLPFILNSAKITAGLTWKSIIMAEFLTVDNGLGALMGNARDSLNTDKVMSYTIIVLLLCFLHQHLIMFFNKR